MRLRHVCHYILTASLLFIFPAPLLANEVSNGSFELGSSGWTTNSSGVLFEVDQMNSFEASRSAKLSYDGASSRGIDQHILNISGDEQYRITGAIKLDHTNVPNSAYIRIAWYASADASGTQLSTAPINNNDGALVTTDWSPVDYIVQAPSIAQSAEIRLYVQGGGAYFDAITFAPTISPTPTTTKTPTLPPTQVPTVPTTMPTLTPTMSTMKQKLSYENIFISEVMVAPNSGEYEWVELYNGNEFNVTLTNWYIDDIGDAGSTPRLITTSLPANGYEIVELSSGIFNNSGDTVRLLDNTSTLKHEFVYTTSEKGYTWGAKNAAFNSFCIQSPSKRMSNSECITVSDDSSASVQAAAVTVSPPPTSILGAHNSSSNSLKPQTHNYYRIVVTPPELPAKQSTQIHHSTTVYSSHQSSDNTSQLPFLAGTYSLLSGISLGLKVYLKQTSNISI
ncbi:MAG: lamin tail domain-containing protein [bacterium]|nr:lamin tail domain-containing protein [bacterium]